MDNKQKVDDLKKLFVRVESEPGWDDELAKFYDKIVPLVKEAEEKKIDVKFLQIKQKFGSARVYVYTPDDYNHEITPTQKETVDKIKAVAQELEEVLSYTCEFCGKQDQKEVHAREYREWLWCSCKKCIDELKKAKK